MNVFDPPVSYYVLNGYIEKPILDSLREIFLSNADKKGKFLGYSRFQKFMRNLTDHLAEYVEYDDESVQIRDIIVELQEKQIRNLLTTSGVRFYLNLANTQLTAEIIEIDLPHQGTIRLNPVDVTSTLDQYVVYKRKELDLPFTFSINIQNKMLEQDYFNDGVPKEGFGLLLEMLVYIDTNNIQKSKIKLNDIERIINHLLDAVMEELLIGIQQENISMLLRTLVMSSEESNET